MTITSQMPCWYDKENEKNAGELMMNQIRYIDDNSGFQSAKNLRNVRLYGDMNLIGLAPYNYAMGQNAQAVNVGPTRVTLNVVQSCVDTLVSKMGKQKIKPTFITKGGDYYARKKAKDLDKFMFGLFHKLKVSSVAKDTLKDTLVIGTGAIRVFQANDEVKIEKVFCEQLKIDDLEAFNGDPRTLYYYKFVDRHQLASLYKDDQDKYDAILTAPVINDSQTTFRSLQNLIMVVEAWHLPSYEGADDGRHAIGIEGCTLEYNDYKKDKFPFAFLRYTKQPLGFWARSIADQLSPIQLEINKTIYKVQKAMNLSASPKILVPTESKIPSGILDNEVSGIIRYSAAGGKPDFIAPQPISQMAIQYINDLYQKAYELTGISRLSAQSSKPSGLNSGKALREFSDIESERFISLGQDYEEFHIDLAYLLLEEVRDIVSRTGSYKALSFDRKHGVEPIDINDIGEIDDFIIQVFPGSQLSQTPAGKKQDVLDLVQAGMVTPDQALDLMDMPDLENFKSLKSASSRVIDKMLCKIQEEEKFYAPETYYDLQLAKEQGHLFYLRAQIDNAPDKVLRLFQQWIEACEQLQNKANSAQQPQVMAQPTMNPAMNPAQVAAQYPMAEGIAAPAL